MARNMPSSFTGLLSTETLTTTLTTLQQTSKGKIPTFGVLVLPSITGGLGGGWGHASPVAPWMSNYRLPNWLVVVVVKRSGVLPRRWWSVHIRRKNRPRRSRVRPLTMRSVEK